MLSKFKVNQVSIIHCIPSVAEEASGPTYSVLKLCEYLYEKSLSIKLIALQEDTKIRREYSSILKTFPIDKGISRLGGSSGMKNWLDQQARQENISLIHNHSLWMMPNIYPGWIAKKYNIPLMVAPRGTLSKVAFKSGSPIKRLFWPLIQKPALQATTCFHATAESEYDDIRRMGFRQPVAIIPNGIEIPEFPSVKQTGVKRTLLFLGRIHPIKGLDILLKAWSIVSSNHPEWQLKIIGPSHGDYLNKLKGEAAQLNLQNIEFCEPLFGEDKVDAYRNADLFILPSHSENFGMVVAEALACGTPVIASQATPWSGLEKNACGWWFDLGLDSLMDVLEKSLSSSPQLLLEMGVRGRQWMAEEYSWHEIGKKTCLTYDWILNNASKPDWVIEE